MSDEEKEALEILNNTEWDGFMITIKNLIEKQQKEIEELKDKDKQHKQRIAYLENKIFNQKQTIKNGINVKKLDVNSLCKNFNLISKDKIKAKIEEIDKSYEDSKNEDGESEYYYPNYTVEVLQSLLKEE